MLGAGKVEAPPDQPDVVVIDVSMPIHDGTASAEQVLRGSQGPKVLMRASFPPGGS